MPTLTRTNAAYRTDVYAAIRAELESVTHARADKALVRAIADRVLVAAPTFDARLRAMERAMESFYGHLPSADLVVSLVGRIGAVETPSLPQADPGDFPFIHGLPDAPAIAWVDAERRERVALRIGHPGNGVWIHNGRQVGAQVILDLLGDIRPAALDFRSNPQSGPSEYRK